MRIVVVSFYQTFLPTFGSASVTYNLTKYLPGEKHLIQLGNNEENRIIESNISLVNIKCITNTNITKFFNLTIKFPKIIAKIKQLAPEFIVLKGAAWVLYYLILFLFLKFKKIKSKTVYHGHCVEYLLRKQKNNIFIAVITKWATKVVKDFFHTEPIVLYPPVPESPIVVPWEKKENGFIWVGRFTPEKKMEKVVKIIKKVREQGLNMNFHIIGVKTDPAYFKLIKKYQKRYKHWIYIEKNKDEASKLELISKYRYGINGRENEPFGIAIAEVVKAGCILGVPKGGGQIEIVNHEDLIFSSEKDAVAKIVNTLSNKKRQYELLEHLKEQTEKFAVDRFRKKVRELVEGFS